MIRGWAIDRYVKKHPPPRPCDVKQDSHRFRGLIEVLKHLAENNAIESIRERSHDYRIEEIA